MIKLPAETIKIGYRDYTVIPILKSEFDGEVLGLFNFGKGIIKIYTDTDARSVAATTIHEICHAVYAEWGIKDGDTEEPTVTAMATGLATIWRDNPIWFNWIGKHLKG